MRSLIKIFFIIVILVFEIFLFHFSLEIGAVSLVLIFATLFIGYVLKKITTVVEQSSLAFSSEPFRDSTKNGENGTKPDTEKKSDSDNLVPGIDSSIFEQFRKKFNLKQPESVEEDTKAAALNSQNSASAAKAYEKVGGPDEPESFDAELEDADQVKVTLSENVKIIKELKGEKIDEDTKENFLEKPEITLNDEADKNNKLGAGEEALELLTKKHQALKKQNNKELLGDQVEEGDDLFADELVSIPGGETLIEEEKEELFEENVFSSPIENVNYEDEEGLELTLRQATPYGEKSDEAEGLLKLAITACETGKMEEAKAGLKTYFKLLNELGKRPSKNVLHLAEKLEITFEYDLDQASSTLTKELSEGDDMNSEKNIRKEPEKTDYSEVMDGIVKTLEKKEAYDEALPLLKDLLKFNRERVNISAMDPLLERIEHAHASMKNNKELVETYKEHLAIKQQLDDMEGELRLLDLISNHYEKSGDQKAAERYRAEIQRIRDDLKEN